MRMLQQVTRSVRGARCFAAGETPTKTTKIDTFTVHVRDVREKLASCLTYVPEITAILTVYS